MGRIERARRVGVGVGLDFRSRSRVGGEDEVEKE
jgi:hypothetical protein